MKSFKRPQNQLENKKTFFFLIGLLVALWGAYAALQWRSYDQTMREIGIGQVVFPMDEPEPPMEKTYRNMPQPPTTVVAALDPTDPITDPIFDPIIEPTPYTGPADFDTLPTIGSFEPEVILSVVAVQHKPIFKGCEVLLLESERFECLNESLMRFVGKNYKFPRDAQSLRYGGRIFVSFIIEKDGSVSHVAIEKGVYESLDQEAMRVIKSLPKFEPAKQNGKAVRVQYVLPITAKMD